MSKELWMKHFSVADWFDVELWDRYLRALEDAVDDRLAKLDTNDPMRREADTKKSEGDFVTAFKAREDSRWLFGKFEKSGVILEITFYKTGLDSLGRRRPNSITLTFPAKMTFGPDFTKVRRAFDVGNQLMSPFYAIADLKDVICARKPCTPSLDISRELFGVFWLTYFGSAYRTFFGGKLDGIHGLEVVPNDGVTLQLGETPSQVAASEREDIIQRLGPDSFANGGPPKERGQFVLTIHQLAEPPQQRTPTTTLNQMT
jgi:hypothetical protein